MNINWGTAAKATVWVLSLTALVAIYAFASRRQSAMVCKSIRVEMLDSERFVSSTQVLHELNTRNLINKKLNLVEIDSLESVFQANPFIARANLSVDLSGILQVKISQKHPFILVKNSLGQQFFIDHAGTKMPFSKADTSAFFRVSGHIAEGFNKSDTLHTPAMKNILILSSWLEKSGLKRPEYRSLAVSDQDELEILPVNQTYSVLLGDTSNLDEKFSKLELMYSTVFPREGTDKYSQVNLEYTGQMVCTLKAGKAINVTKDQPAIKVPAVNKQHTTTIKLH